MRSLTREDQHSMAAADACMPKAHAPPTACLLSGSQCGSSCTTIRPLAVGTCSSVLPWVWGCHLQAGQPGEARFARALPALWEMSRADSSTRKQRQLAYCSAAAPAANDSDTRQPRLAMPCQASGCAAAAQRKSSRAACWLPPACRPALKKCCHCRSSAPPRPALPHLRLRTAGQGNRARWIQVFSAARAARRARPPHLRARPPPPLGPPPGSTCRPCACRLVSALCEKPLSCAPPAPGTASGWVRLLARRIVAALPARRRSVGPNSAAAPLRESLYTGATTSSRGSSSAEGLSSCRGRAGRLRVSICKCAVPAAAAVVSAAQGGTIRGGGRSPRSEPVSRRRAGRPQGRRAAAQVQPAGSPAAGPLAAAARGALSTRHVAAAGRPASRRSGRLGRAGPSGTGQGGHCGAVRQQDGKCKGL